MDGPWTGCRGGAAEIAWEEARDRSETDGQEPVDGRCGRAAVDELWTGGSCRNSMGGG